MIKAISLLCLFFISHNLLAENIDTISVSDSNEISYSVYPADGQHLILWFYSEAGPQKNDIEIAKSLNKLGIEVWLVDLFESYFLPTSLSSMDKIPAKEISRFIESAHIKSAKKVIPTGTGRSSIPLLRAVRDWQTDYPNSSAMPGIILMSPKFYKGTPEPGLDGELMPVVNNSNLLLFIMQPTQSPWYWKLSSTIPALEKNGSDVFIQRIKNVRDRFYFRPDASSYEQELTRMLPLFINNAAQALSKFPRLSRAVKNIPTQKTVIANAKKTKTLRTHKGKSTPPELKLYSLNGQPVDLKQFKDKVVLVNFWATWCPPCVHEMPSMQRLQNQYSTDEFVILGVNMAEKENDINTFLKNKVSVNFPILMDTDGAALQRWSVFAFPTSYVIDKKGQIRYSLFGSIEWDNPQIITIINELIGE